MKKKLLLLLLSTTIILTACGSSTTAETTTSLETTTEEMSSSSENESNQKIEVDEGLFDVELTIPANFIGETTQEELDAVAAENGYKSITLNADGSATYLMTKKQHKSLMKKTTDYLNESISEMIASEDYPNFTDIKVNDNFTEFTITTKSTELSFQESFSSLAFYMYGGFYNAFAGESVDNIKVEFVNADSGEVISTANSKDMENQ